MLRPSRRQLRKWRRENRVRQVIIGGAALLLALIVGILGFGYWRENVARAAEPAATVFGEPITLSELLERVRPRYQALDTQARLYEAQGITQAATQLNLQRSRLPDQVLDSMVEDHLVLREAAERGIAVSNEEIDARIRQAIAEQEALSQPAPTSTPAATPGAEPTAAPAASATATPVPSPTPVPTLTGEVFEGAYQSFLTRANLTDEYYRELIGGEIYKDKLKDSLATNIPRTEEQVHVRHILVDNQESLALVQQRLTEGVPFDAVAKEFSTDAGSRDKGGDLGWFGRGVMNAPFEQAAFNQPIGVIGEPVQSPNGTHIIQVLERDAEHPLGEQQLAQRANQAYQAWYAGRKGSSDVQTQLTPDRRAWIVRQLGSRRAA